MAKDWLFKGDNWLCDLRAAGVLIRDGKILVQRDKNGTEYALPGGHVQVGETTENALKREFQEEMGNEITVQRLLWTEECFWTWNGRQTHNLCFYYLIDGDIADNGAFAPHHDNENVVYGYLPLEELENVTLYPAFLKERIFALGEHPEHFVTYA